MKRFLIFTGLILSIFHPVIFCQQIEYVRGKVIDSKTSRSVSFAAVRLKNARVGIYTNAEGDFRIQNNPGFQSDSLIVTCIGYRKLAVCYGNLKMSGMNILKLEPDIYSLREVSVLGRKRRLSPEAIIARALRNIKRNNPDQPFSYVSYYRDYQKDSSNYLNLNEAIIQTQDKGFEYDSDSNRFLLLDFKKNMDFLRKDITPFYDLPGTDHSAESFKRIPHATVGDQNGNELFVLLVHDAIRNFDKRSFSFVDTLNYSFIRNHLFSGPAGIYDGDKYLYKINFTAKRLITGDSILMQGAIFIQPDDYSIHKLEYTGSFKDFTGKKNKEIFNIEIEYGHEPAVNSRMCLKYISFSNSFTIPDTSDQDYFRIKRLEWAAPGGPYGDYRFNNMTIVAYFNRQIDPVLVQRMDNYELTLGKRKAKITKVRPGDSRIYITVRDDKFRRGELDSCNLTVKGLKDIHGNLLYKRRDLEFRQFRELFVQEYNKPLVFKDSCFMQSVPIESNCISICGDSGRFWMNTPLKAEEGQ
jgi:hypothetical protein